MDPADPISNDDISNSMVHIEINSPNSIYIMRLAGIIVGCDESSFCIITDARAFEGNIWEDKTNSITVTSLSGVKLIPEDDSFYIEGELVGMICFLHPTSSSKKNDLKEIKICRRPLKMCEAVYAYEGTSRRLTPGNVTRFFGCQFSHNCAVTALSEFGSPVLNKDGELVGIHFIFDYQLSARNILSLEATINSICDTLMSPSES